MACLEEKLRRIPALARIISGALNPLFVSAFVFGGLVWGLPDPVPARTTWLLVALLFGTIVPLLYVVGLRLKGSITSLLIPVRRQRTGPLLVGLLSYLCGLVVLDRAGASGILLVLMGCYAASTALAILINLRWKISLHAVGVWGSFIALWHHLGYGALYLTAIPIGVSWARLRLGAHTPRQLLAGGLLGATTTHLLFFLWF